MVEEYAAQENEGIVVGKWGEEPEPQTCISYLAK
jgi:hypothetical protein